MTGTDSYLLHPVGFVRSTLHSRQDAPRQGYEGAPDAWLELYPAFIEALEGITVDSEIIVVTWLHLANRNILKVHPRNELSRPLTGVFATRAPDRPNPVGLHRVNVLDVDPRKGLRVHPMEALDGTPIIDIKPALRASAGE